MGQLKPGATYVYERVNDVVYARKAGSSQRTEVGWTVGWNDDDFNHRGPLHDQIIEDRLWGEIRRVAPTNPALQKALDRAIMIYRLSKDNPE